MKVKFVSRNRLTKPWFDDDLRRLCDMKHELFKKYKANQESFISYNNFKNRFTALLKRTKSNYYKEQFERCRHDIRCTWKKINGIIGSKHRSRIGKIVNGDTEIFDGSVIGELFNDYFTSVAANLRSNIPMSSASPLSFMGDRSQTELTFRLVSPVEVERILSALKNKSCRLNAIPVIVYKSVKTVICTIISNLFNCSVLEGRFPHSLKVAEVIPIFKSGSSSEVKNYRPISILPVLSKLFERLLKVQLVEYLDATSLLSNRQFGFRSGRDTSDAILEFLDHCYSSLDRRRHLIAIFIDLSKAFDTLDHDILISKLEHIGIRGAVLGWIESYLSDRSQFVTVNGCSSSPKPITTGVPQGSVLGPLLFLIYINDMSHCAENLDFVHFADDTTVFSVGSDVERLVNEASREFVRVDDWLAVNKLSLNLSKTNYMIVSHSNIPQNLFTIRGISLPRVNSAKFLGVTIDDKLTFAEHINALSARVSRSVGVIFRLSHYVPQSTLLSLYFALVHSGLSYGVTSWGSSASTHVKRLTSLQNRVVNLLPCIGRQCNYYSYNILKLGDLYKYFCSIKFFKCV